jgi:hypothetical protein
VAPLLSSNVQYAPYDAVAEFHAKDVQHFREFIDAAWASPEVAADIAKFVDMEHGLHILPGYDGLIFGKAIQHVGEGKRGRDGILPGDGRLVYSERP